ncbi:exodeoxyribonuclease V subunit gamma, partial [Rhodoferax sp.]|uniref:exodeoxyribonuclease V subunit gamma n=1 Tax=Rhodoferax sp. TaxID=50421 RepID=UPI002622FCEE
MSLHSSAGSEAAWPTGFMVLHGNRLEDLRDLLVQLIQARPLPPLQPEVILLQSNGMKHWLELALADDAALGICAATRMELPSAYLWQMYRTVLGVDLVPAHMPFDKAALLWRLVRLLPTLCQTHPVYAPLQRYLSGDNPARKLYQLALQVADVFDAYQSYRADWLADWAAGLDQLRGPLGAAQSLPPDHAWQAQLWRDIRADVGETLAQASRASVHERFLAALASAAQRPGGLPQRLIVFGISSLPMQAVQALAALGRVCQVLLLVQNPCQYYWGDLVEGHAQLRQQVRRRQQAKPFPADPAAPLAAPAARHPLLASWGKQGRDYLHLLDGFDQPEHYRAHWSRVDLFVDPAA